MKKHVITVLALCMTGLAAIAAQPRSASAPVKLIESASGLMAPVWSPDGSKIAVTADNYTGILVADANGKNLRSISTEPGAGYKMAWSKDGKQIMGRVNVYEGSKVNHQTKAWAVADGSLTRKGEVMRSAAAPMWEKTGSAYDIMVQDPAGAVQRIAGLNGYTNAIVINPALSPDGSTVAFQIPGHGVLLCDANGENVREFCAGSHPQWLPDGENLIVTRVSDNGSTFTASDIYAVSVANGQEVLLTGNTDIIPLTPTVSPDGKKVAFENAADASIYVINLNY